MSQVIVYVAYPEAFGSYSKFSRKLEKILQNKTFKINFDSDPNSFIDAFCKQRKIESCFFESSTAAIDNSSHAVFFEDRDCFYLPKQRVMDRNMPYRTVVLELTKVVNRDKGDPYDVYIGRGTIWGNPYQMGVDGDREEVIRKFKYDFDNGLLKVSGDLETNLSNLRGKQIACHCKPAACHGDVIAEYLNSQDDGK